MTRPPGLTEELQWRIQGNRGPSRSKIIKIHGLVATPVMLLSTVRVASHCRNFRYSVREGTSIARSTRFISRLGNRGIAC